VSTSNSAVNHSDRTAVYYHVFRAIFFRAFPAQRKLAAPQSSKNAPSQPIPAVCEDWYSTSHVDRPWQYASPTV
jgi:hypothetical protein